MLFELKEVPESNSKRSFLWRCSTGTYMDIMKRVYDYIIFVGDIYSLIHRFLL